MLNEGLEIDSPVLSIPYNQRAFELPANNPSDHTVGRLPELRPKAVLVILLIRLSGHKSTISAFILNSRFIDEDNTSSVQCIVVSVLLSEGKPVPHVILRQKELSYS